MRNRTKNINIKNMKKGSMLIIFGFCLIHGCLQQEDMPEPVTPTPQVRSQCVTPIQSISLSVSSGGISTIPDGSLFGVATNFGVIYLFNSKGDSLWSREGIGSRYALLLDKGNAMLVGDYNKEESWKSTIVKFDSQGNVLWERQTGLIGSDGLAVTPDGSFIAVGATDEEKKGHLMLFDGDGNKLWDHQIDGIISEVAVSTSGYVFAGPRDRYIYVYDQYGELIFTYFTGRQYDPQSFCIAPDESFFLFNSERKYLNCCTFEGEFLWQKEVGDLSNVEMSPDGEYIVAVLFRKLLFLDKYGNELWSKKVSSAWVDHLAFSTHGEYIAMSTQNRLFLPTLYLDIYNREGELLWRYEGSQPFDAIAISGDGHYIAAGNLNVLVVFDNFKAIEEYASSRCAQKKSSFFSI